MIRNLLMMVTVALSTAACAFVDHKIQLEPRDPPIVAAGDIAGDQVFLSLFQDTRANKRVIGEVVNNYGMRTANLITKDTPAIWLANGLKTALENAGYTVIATNGDFKPAFSEFTVSGDLTRIFGTPHVRMLVPRVKGEVEATLVIRYAGDVHTRLVQGRASFGVAAVTAGSYKKVIHQAHRDFLEKAVAWINDKKKAASLQ